MGVKGSKSTEDGRLAAELLISRLEPIEGVSSKKMFGGHGIFHEGKMFAIIDSKGVAYFKVDDSNRADYEQNGAHKHGKMSYYTLPDVVLNDSQALLTWAEKSIELSKK